MIDSHLQKRLTEFISCASKPLIVILGPTASGKTGFSIELAHALKYAEVVNADSRQLYKFLDIGTAKITPEEMQGVPHHLLDILDPKEEVTAAWYKREAQSVIDDIHVRKKVPVLTGGSMLYISAVIDGLEFGAGGTESGIRLNLEKEYDADGGAALHARLAGIDPDTAAAFSPNNKPYVVRAMEIYEMTGKKPSDVRKSAQCPYDLLIIGVERPRPELVARINERTSDLFRKGWIDEVQGLIAKGYSSQDPGMKSHGYREIIDHKRSGVVLRTADEHTWEKLAEKISAKTRQYAKRQMTWWKHDERINWMTP